MMELTNTKIEALLYGGEKVETERIFVSSWFDDSISKKNIEIYNVDSYFI